MAAFKVAALIVIWTICSVSAVPTPKMAQFQPDDVSAQATTLAAAVSPLPPQHNLTLTDVMELQILADTSRDMANLVNKRIKSRLGISIPMPFTRCYTHPRPLGTKEEVFDNLKNDTLLLRALRPVLSEMIAFEEMYKNTINMTAATATAAAIYHNASTNATITSSSNNPIIANITNSEILRILLIDLKHTFNQLLTAMEQSFQVPPPPPPPAEESSGHSSGYIMVEENTCKERPTNSLQTQYLNMQETAFAILFVNLDLNTLKCKIESNPFSSY